jgi:galactokinase
VTITVPGRVNLIGEHIDYLGFPVLPMAIARQIHLEFQPRADNLIRVEAARYGVREFAWTPGLKPWPAGDFGNYLKAAARTVGNTWGLGNGFDGVIASTIPPAAGLSSSSALFIAATLALLRVRHIRAGFSELMQVLPEGETFVGTRGGGMDHAACLAGRRGCALRVDFDPVRVEPVPIPGDWAFFVAHSLQTAEKSGPSREEYNRRRALAQAGDPAALRHAHSERARVERAIAALRAEEREQFGALLNQSHRSLRDDLKVSCESADRLAGACVTAGADGARIMGAGFGGYVVALCRRKSIEEVMARLDRDHFARRENLPKFPDYLMQVEAEEGALSEFDR